jgi:vanillate O-demethylase monooxygenase subunit
VAQQFPGVIAQDLWILVEQQKMIDMPERRYGGEMHLRADTGILKAREVVREMVAAEAAAP